MSNLSGERTKLNGKIVGAALAELVIVFGSFVLFSSRFDVASWGGIGTILIIGYPIFVSVCTAIVVASIAETRHIAGWKWGGLAAAITLFLIIMLATVPSFISAFAFLIAPVVAIAASLNTMNARESNQSQ
jgi:hypothetical protein